ncbi:2'-5' RNA ligase family protein [Cyclobacterium jeungdonense]|uniref:2'-5' RNA ligase family protein n=1 Tax=Cyclobacterium jeungdonense TaxID=708087 RepID=A0ABT8C6A7_9BACT|nr:2'-5' RNA ligase family protein [Cyclobacterium jeungdonense]MDN3687148.1 2'-5' RNA ligase family protein [Cyclobacterium jeungdonense]
MAKSLKKYFIGIVPDEPLRREITELKLAIQERFGYKFALKSPPHITLKMPFLFNENKEEQLENKLRRFFGEEKGFSLEIEGVGSFREKVVFLRVKYPPELPALQQRLVTYGKRHLGHQIELSDLNYHPHLTVAFRDIKKGQFGDLMAFLRPRFGKQQMAVRQVSLLKKASNSWQIQNNFDLME